MASSEGYFALRTKLLMTRALQVPQSVIQLVGQESMVVQSGIPLNPPRCWFCGIVAVKRASKIRCPCSPARGT